jgi:glycosyltransferase involved in cell wall biosynthesis
MNRPVHSVILGSYNRPKMVARAIRSVLAQSNQSFQLIVTDDGSNGETLASIRATLASDPRAFLLTREHEADGVQRTDCANRAVQRINDAIPHVQGEIVHYLPDDDFFHESRFETFDSLFSNPGVFAGYGRLVYVNSEGIPLGPTRYPEGVSDPLGTLDQNQVAHRRGVFDRIPKWADAVDWASEGHFFRAVSRIWQFHGLDRVVAYKTEHDLCMSRTQTKSTGKREP